MTTRLVHPTRREWISAAAFVAAGALAFDSAAKANSVAQTPTSTGVSHTAESIHQEINLAATPKRVYGALTIAAQFQKVESFSDAAKSMNLATNPVEIGAEPGAAFSLFGGYITGRQIELVANQRIVQVWRVGNWPAGKYSLVRFDLAANSAGTGTLLTFDHTSFPAGEADHLAEGWYLNYWNPLTKFLAQP